MRSIPSRMNQWLRNRIQQTGVYKRWLFLIFVLLAVVLGSLLWGAAAIGSGRQFRLLMLLSPLLISYLIYLFYGKDKPQQMVLPAWFFFIISFFIGKYVIFSHYFTYLPDWLETEALSDFRTAMAYIPYLFHSTQMSMFFGNISGVLDTQDIAWLLAGMYIIWRNGIFSGQKPPKSSQKRKYFNRRFTF